MKEEKYLHDEESEEDEIDENPDFIVESRNVQEVVFRRMLNLQKPIEITSYYNFFLTISPIFEVIINFCNEFSIFFSNWCYIVVFRNLGFGKCL